MESNYFRVKWKGNQPWQTELTVGVFWRGVSSAAAAVGAVHASIEEKTLAAAMEDGTAQTAHGREAQDRHSARQPALRQDRQRLAQPAVHRRQSDRRLGPQPRPDVRVQAVHVLQHRGQGLRDPGTGPGVRHQHDPVGPCLLGRGDEVQPERTTPRSRPWSASRWSRTRPR